MLYKCANSACPTLFRSMHQGKLFQVEREAGKPLHMLLKTARQNIVRHRIEHYWLCDQCFPLFTLTYDSQRGVLAIPLITATTNFDRPKQIPVLANQIKLSSPNTKKPMHSVQIGHLPTSLAKSTKSSITAGAL